MGYQICAVANQICESVANQIFSKEKYPYQSDTYTIIGLCMEVHNILGKGLAEIVYKDALEIELRSNHIYYQREKKYELVYKGNILPHHFYADFVIENKIILEIKCKKNILDEHYASVINYLAISKCSLGLIVNFATNSLETKRIIF